MKTKKKKHLKLLHPVLVAGYILMGFMFSAEVQFWLEEPDASFGHWTEQPAASVELVPCDEAWQMPGSAAAILCEQAGEPAFQTAD